MSGEVLYTVPFKYNIRIYNEQNKIYSEISDFQANACRIYPVTNLSPADFLKLSLYPLKCLSKMFQLSQTHAQLVFLPGLKGGGIRSSKNKVISNIVALEGNLTTFSNSIPMGQNSFNEVSTYKDKIHDITQDRSFTMIGDLQIIPEESSKNFENHLTQASLDRLLGVYFKQIGKLKEAKKKFLECYSARKHFCNPGEEDLSQVLLDLAEVSFEEGISYRESLEYYTTCLKNSQLDFEKNQKFVEAINMGLMKVYAKLKDTERVAECQEMFEKLAPDYNNERLAEEYLQIGLDLIEVDPNSSEWYLMKVYNLIGTTPSFSRKRILFKGLGDISYLKKNYAESRVYYEKALKVDDKEKSLGSLELIVLYKNLSNVYEMVGDIEKSVEMNEKILSLTSELASEDEEMVESLVLVGIQYTKAKNVNKAVDCFKRAIEINFKLRKSNIHSVAAFENLANLQFCQEKYAEAKQNFLILQDIYKTGNEHRENILGDCLSSLGQCCNKLEQYLEAEAYFSECFNKNSWVENRKEVEKDYFSYAWTLFRLNKFDDSGFLYEKAAEYFQKKPNTDFQFLKICYKSAENSFDKAKNYQQALKSTFSNLKIMLRFFESDTEYIEKLKQNANLYKKKLELFSDPV